MTAFDWQTDWLYCVILREAEKAWDWCQTVPGRDVWKYVLVEEYWSGDDSRCRGDVIRAWVRDEGGLRQISLAEHGEHQRKLEGKDIYPFIMVQFHVHPDRKHVVIGQSQAMLAGSGTGYLIEGSGREARLCPESRSRILGVVRTRAGANQRLKLTASAGPEGAAVKERTESCGCDGDEIDKRD